MKTATQLFADEHDRSLMRVAPVPGVGRSDGVPQVPSAARWIVQNTGVPVWSMRVPAAVHTPLVRHETAVREPLLEPLGRAGLASLQHGWSVWAM